MAKKADILKESVEIAKEVIGDISAMPKEELKKVTLEQLIRKKL